MFFIKSISLASSINKITAVLPMALTTNPKFAPKPLLNPECPPTPPQHPISVFSLISSSHETFVPRRKESPLAGRPYQCTGSEQSMIQDRFIPHRSLLNLSAFTINAREEAGEGCTTVADLYWRQMLGTGRREQLGGIGSFVNQNQFRYKLARQSKNQAAQFQSNKIQEPERRKINKIPYRVLDAPALSEDFYVKLIDWSHSNNLAVALDNAIYIWNGNNSKVTKLCEIPNEAITSVCWSPAQSLLAFGCDQGSLLIWDVQQQKQVQRLSGHAARVGAMAWSRKLLATGSKDKSILLRDPRSPQHYTSRLNDHHQQICGLKWSYDDQYLASGGNDSRVVIWNDQGQAINKFYDHKAAVKAIAWSPYQHGLLATGGGTVDRMIKLRNIFTNEILCEEDTGSQVCNLEFSKTTRELVSTHGYSQNEINVWAYPRLRKLATLRGHTQRVLYLALSPDGSTIVTGAGDETLRFWSIFPPLETAETWNKSGLDCHTPVR